MCVLGLECCNGAESHVVAIHKWLCVEDCKLYNRRWFEVAVQTSAESESPRQTYINIQTQTDADCLKQCWITVTQLQSTAGGLEYAYTHSQIPHHTHTPWYTSIVKFNQSLKYCIKINCTLRKLRYVVQFSAEDSCCNDGLMTVLYLMCYTAIRQIHLLIHFKNLF